MEGASLIRFEEAEGEGGGANEGGLGLHDFHRDGFHEIGQAADGAPTALPTGHPLAAIFLLKYGPQDQELQEGVAFHGRAGNALIKSLQRLHVDPMEVYGTNAVKFAG